RLPEQAGGSGARNRPAARATETGRRLRLPEQVGGAGYRTDENRPLSRAASDPGLALSDGQGYVPKGPVRVARTAGGADVCGFARAYVQVTGRLNDPYTATNNPGYSSSQQSNIRPVREWEPARWVCSCAAQSPVNQLAFANLIL